MRTHLIGFTSTDGPAIARVTSNRQRPSWRECAAQIPAFRGGGTYLGLAPESENIPVFRLTYDSPVGEFTKIATADGIEENGARIMRMADDGDAWNIRVLDANGADVTFEFECFV